LEINQSYHSETRQLAVQLVITRETSSVFSLCLKILIDSEDLTNSDKSFQTDGEARLNAVCETFNWYSGFDDKFSELERTQRTGV